MILLQRLMMVEALRILLAVIAIAIAIVLLSGCSTLAAEKAAAEAEYAGQQLACVDKAKTLEESHVCRAEVRRKWGIAETQVQKDGGR